MKFSKAIDVWSQHGQYLLKSLQPGQWVYAGEPSSKGRFLGIKPSGTIVVAWHNNAKKQGRGQYKPYVRALRDYALGV